jgi:hypothetical protein
LRRALVFPICFIAFFFFFQIVIAACRIWWAVSTASVPILWLEGHVTEFGIGRLRYAGTLRDYSAIHWYYGQFDEKAIDTAFKMLEKMPKYAAANMSMPRTWWSQPVTRHRAGALTRT